MQQTDGSNGAGGPSTSGAWQPAAPSLDGARIWTVCGSNEGAQYAVREPVVSRTPFGGAPLFSLTLTLARQPAAGESSIIPPIRGGACAMTVDVVPSAAELAAAQGAIGVCVPLFPRGASFAVVRLDGAAVISEAVSEGSTGRVGLTTTLGAEDGEAIL